MPDVRKDAVKPDDEPEEQSDLHRVEAVLGPRFPGINKKLKDFNFKRHYGAEVKEIKRNGQSYVQDLENEYFREGDTLVVMADDSFVQTWGESSVFVMLANGKDTEPVASKGKRWFALALLILMITGATVGELPAVKEVKEYAKMTAINDLHIGASYNVFKGVSVYAQVHNLLNKKYQYYLGYPTEGFNFLGGLSFRF